MKKLILPFSERLVLKQNNLLSHAETAISREAELMEQQKGPFEDFSLTTLNNWFESLTPEESAEYERLSQIHMAAEEVLDNCIDKSKTLPEECIHPCCHEITPECSAKCPVYLRQVKTERDMQDFQDKHGKHICYECQFWGTDRPGECEKKRKYVRGTTPSCNMFRTETVEEITIRNREEMATDHRLDDNL